MSQLLCNVLKFSVGGVSLRWLRAGTEVVKFSQQETPHCQFVKWKILILFTQSFTTSETYWLFLLLLQCEKVGNPNGCPEKLHQWCHFCHHQ